MSKTLPSSTGYFNKEMLAILKDGEKKTSKKSAGAKRKGAKKK